MFAATLANGKIVAEGRDLQSFDDIPDSMITSLQLNLPYTVFKKVGDKTLKRHSVLSIGRYDKYYCAKQAIANVMSMGAGEVGILAGQGQITHEIMAGIDEGRNEVIYIELRLATGDVKLDKFDLDWWLKTAGINPALFKRGAPKKA